jgi:hypothetical protein
VYLPGTVRIPKHSSPNTKNIDHTLVAEVEIPRGGAEEVLVCCGGDQYGSPFPFTGTVKRVLVDVSDAEFSDLVAMAKVAMAMQ